MCDYHASLFYIDTCKCLLWRYLCYCLCGFSCKCCTIGSVVSLFYIRVYPVVFELTVGVICLGELVWFANFPNEDVMVYSCSILCISPLCVYHRTSQGSNRNGKREAPYWWLPTSRRTRKVYWNGQCSQRRQNSRYNWGVLLCVYVHVLAYTVPTSIGKQSMCL